MVSRTRNTRGMHHTRNIKFTMHFKPSCFHAYISVPKQYSQTLEPYNVVCDNVICFQNVTKTTTEIPTIIDPSATKNYPSATKSYYKLP